MACRDVLTTVEPDAPPSPISPADLPLESGRVETWHPTRLTVDPGTVLRLARCRPRDDIAPAIRDAASAMAARAEALVEPTARLAPARVAAVEPGGVRLAGGPRFSGRTVTAGLAGCPLAVGFVLTVGPRLEREVTALAERRELLESFLLDTAGWAAIEAAVRALRLHLRERVRPSGWRVGHRVAPGSGDWPLTEQAALLGLFGADTPVRLSEHGVLVPFKSVTGVFGLGPAR
jgi:hypothetical protein